MAKFTAGNIRILHPDWYTVLVGSYLEAKRAAEVFDLNAAIINQELPDGDGLELLIELQEKNSCLSPIILVPTSFPQKLREIAKICGAFSVLEKPTNNDALITALEGAIAQFSQKRS
ncbi:MAG: response regulator [Deltaproteobacteria bacterium]|nr:MAG: response regulator [Deltaproteobacteria bacterium]